MRVGASRDALAELREARKWYRDQSRRAEREFKSAYDRAVAQLRAFPLSGAPYLRGTRRIVFTRFPYSLVYRVETERVQIVAIAHAKREPGYWLRR